MAPRNAADPRLRLPVHPAHRAPGARAGRVQRDPARRPAGRRDRSASRRSASCSRAVRPRSTRRARSGPIPGCSRSACPCSGICYGQQAMAHAARRRRSSRRGAASTARAELRRGPDCPLFAGTPAAQRVWMSHGDRVDARCRTGFTVVGRTANAPVAAMADEARRFYGIQFHPEVRHTELGRRILDNFLTICGARRDWTPASIRREAVAAHPRAGAGAAGSSSALSGGVDSTVTALLCREAVGERTVPIFVDTGLLRLDEGDKVRGALRAVRAAGRPGQRRRALLRASGRRRGPRGEAAADRARVHRGVRGGGAALPGRALPRAGHALPGRHRVHLGARAVGHDQDAPQRRRPAGAARASALVEPLRELFKDEVRRLGEELGPARGVRLAAPVPGPGLAVRILGEVTPERVVAAAARRRRSSWRRSAPPGCTARSPRRSRCCCRCAASA